MPLAAIVVAAACLVSSRAAPAPLLPADGGHEPIRPIPLLTALDARKVALGHRLFHEPRLSHDNTIACASCHDLGHAGTDGRARSLGIHGAAGTFNAPSVFNAVFNFRQFWDGRAATLEEQIDSPVESAVEMGSTWPEIVAKLRATPEYAAAFTALYRDGVAPRNIQDAIATFERSLTTPNARFDRYLRGDAAALTEEEKAGYEKFKSHGCASCHQGVNVGGNLFEDLGVMADYFTERGHITRADWGRFNVTGREEDRFVFKVPSLRNVARTAPYFHDGSVARLEDAVAVMGRYQLGEALPPEDVAQIVKFLETLTGEYGGQPL